MSGDDRRTTYHPAFYRVVVRSIAGPMHFDFQTLDRARREAGGDGKVLACWYVEGQYALDTEVVR